MTNKMRLGLVVLLAPIAFLLITSMPGNEKYADYFLPVFWISFAIGIILMLWGAMDLMVGPRKLLKTGTLALARVDRVRQTGTIINDVNVVVELHLTVRPEGAPAFHATTKTIVPIHQPDQFARGQHIPVRFDPAKPGRVAVDPNPPAE